VKTAFAHLCENTKESTSDPEALSFRGIFYKGSAFCNTGDRSYVYLKIVVINVCRTAITHYNGLRKDPQKKEIVENMILAYGICRA
jgi:hypothetical protein